MTPQQLAELLLGIARAQAAIIQGLEMIKSAELHANEDARRN